jgi:hypothetical protein
VSRESRAETGRGPLLPIGLLLPVTVSGPLATTASAEKIIVFLQDGRTIQAEKTEIVGDRIRIERPSETIEIPRSDVLSIHPATPPQASPSTPPPTDVYRDITPQMTDKVRREIPEPCALGPDHSLLFAD